MSATVGVAHKLTSRERFAPCVDFVSAPGRRPSCAVGELQSFDCSPRLPIPSALFVFLFGASGFAVGVCHICTATPSGIDAPLPLYPLSFNRSASARKLSGVSCSFSPLAFGVGHWRTASVNVVPACLPLSVEYPAAPEELESCLVAVGQHEEPLASVRRSNVRRPNKTPLRIEPERGKVFEHGVESETKVACDVLKENERRFALRDDADDVRPEVALVCGSELFSGDAERLTGVSRCDAIHCTAPAFAVEG